mmetsp:Transcript_30323/g.77857  ORF Transcript_30323/g.77857 Transcript_30323/m.77857 type:complete len:270 (-) Transcript_30323:1084-1893(-)
MHFLLLPIHDQVGVRVLVAVALLLLALLLSRAALHVIPFHTLLVQVIVALDAALTLAIFALLLLLVAILIIVVIHLGSAVLLLLAALLIGIHPVHHVVHRVCKHCVITICISVGLLLCLPAVSLNEAVDNSQGIGTSIRISSMNRRRQVWPLRVGDVIILPGGGAAVRRRPTSGSSRSSGWLCICSSRSGSSSRSLPPNLGGRVWPRENFERLQDGIERLRRLRVIEVDQVHGARECRHHARLSHQADHVSAESAIAGSAVAGIWLLVR